VLVKQLAEDEAIKAADRCGRRVALCGKSMVRNVATAIDLGYLSLPSPDILIPVEEAVSMPDRAVAVLTTGSQGEPRSALTLMALGEHKHLKVRAVFIPVHRDELLPALVAGKGDIAAANLTITPERQNLVDFTEAGMGNVSEVVVSGPASPTVASLDDLSGKDVFARKSSSYYESLVALNEKFAAEQKPQVTIREAPETLEDEDLIEMLNAGLIPLIVVDKHKADLWKQVFSKITVHEAVAVRTGAEVAAAIRLLATRARVVAEGAGAAALAAALTGKAGKGRVACVVSGGNIDPSKLARILEGGVP